MFRQFSRINIFFQLITILVVAVILFMPVIMNPAPTMVTKEPHPLYTFFILITGGMPIFMISVAIGILIFLSFFLYAILISHDMHPRESLLPVIFYLILAAGLKDSVGLGPALIASIFLIISLFLIIRIYGSNQPYKQVFSASFCVSVAALFYAPAMTFMLFIWLSFLTYRIASWREWVISLIGAIVPLLYMISYFFWIGKLPGIFFNFGDFFNNPLTRFPKFGLWQMIFLGFSGIALLMGLFRQIILIQDRLISIRRKTWIFIDFIIVAVLSAFLAGNDLRGHIAIIAIPGALFLSSSVTGKKASFTYELVAIIMVILLVFSKLSV
jgi:hypothetical protein